MKLPQAHGSSSPYQLDALELQNATMPLHRRGGVLFSAYNILFQFTTF